MPERRSIAAVAVLLTTALPLTALQPSEPLESDLTEEVELRYVIIDTLVIDSHNRIVPDLTRDDFVLHLDMKPYPIETVHLDCPAGAAEDPRAQGVGERREAPVAPEVQRRIVLAVDYRHLPQTRRVAVIENLEEMVRSAEAPGEELMVAAITQRLRIEQPFTTDRSEVLKALDRMKNDPSLWQEPHAPHPHQLPFFEALTSLVRLLARYDGVKAIVLYSDMPSLPSIEIEKSRGWVVGRDFDYDRQFEAIATSATNSRTAIYTAHASGLTFGPSSTALARLAADTGGRFTEHTNDLSLAYARAQRDQACRYAIGFPDRTPESDRLHTVSLGVSPRRGYRVIHPSLYQFGTSEKAESSLADTAYTAPRAFLSAVVRGRVFPIRPASRKTWHAAIEMRFAVGIPEAGSRTIRFGAKLDDVYRRAAHHVDRTLTVQPGGERDEQPIVVAEPVELAPGAYELSIVVIDPAAEEPRTAVIPVELPPLPRRGLVMVEPVLARDVPGGLFMHWGEGLDHADDDLEPLLEDEPVWSGPVTALGHVCRIGKKRLRKPVRIERSLRGEDGTAVLTREPLMIELAEKGKLHCEPLLDTLATESLKTGTYGYEVSARSDRYSEPIRKQAAFSFDPPARTAQAPSRPEPTLAVVEIAPAETEIEWPEPAATASTVTASATRTPMADEHPSLAPLLERLDRMADLYHDSALGFTCVETVEFQGKKTKYDYIYKVVDGELKDRHVPRAIVKRSVMLRQPKYVPAGIARPSLWTGVFDKVRQPYNRYGIAGRETMLGRSAIKVSFEPRPGSRIIPEVNDWVGTAWVDEETSQILKVVAYDAREYGDYLLLMQRHEQGELGEKPSAQLHEVTTYTSWFGDSKNGMRFPTEIRSERKRYVVSEEDLDDPRSGGRIFLVRQTFGKYRFFGVKTAEQILEIVDGGALRRD